MRFPLPSRRIDFATPRLRQAGLALAFLLALVLGVVGARSFLAWRLAQQPVGKTEAQAVETLARDTQSPRVWAIYRHEANGGMTRAGAERVREAAKAAPPPYGLLSDQ